MTNKHGVTCPTPIKLPYRNEVHARQEARKIIRARIGTKTHAVPLYGYRCRCGRWHHTSHDMHDGLPNVLLWQVDDRLQTWAITGELPPDDTPTVAH